MCLIEDVQLPRAHALAARPEHLLPRMGQFGPHLEQCLLGLGQHLALPFDPFAQLFDLALLLLDRRIARRTRVE